MKITVLDGYTLNPGDNAWQPVEALGELTVYDRTAADQIMERSQDADILLTNKTPLDANTLARLTQLKFIGVMATGCDRIYPAENNKLAHAMSEQGLLVSEFCPGAQPHRWHFPRRNRTLSGLALATVVVEAGRPSGTLITAAAAGEQGREVFAFPWSVRHKGGAGCLYLLQQGATLATSASDILIHLSQILRGWFDLAPNSPHSKTQLVAAVSDGKCGAAPSEGGPLSDNARDLLVAMGDGGFDIASLCQAQGVDMPAMLTLLTQLELGGYVQQTAQGLWHVRAGGKC